MPGITFKTSDKIVTPYDFGNGPRINNPKDVLRHTWEAQNVQQVNFATTKSIRCKDLLQSSLPQDPKRIGNFIPRANGFVDTVLMAYNQHHNLIIRPDDLWVAILSQLNLYVNAHSEELRKFFVQHEGKKELVLSYGGTRRSFDFRIMARDFATLLRGNINDPAFYDFVLPNFSTTEHSDTVICSIVMMSILKSYFSFTCELSCGIPEITLLGTKEDYLNILRRIENLSQMEMGAEPTAFAMLLKPIIKEFIAVFDAVDSSAKNPRINKDFWGRICHEQHMGSGSNILSGWITAFCIWDKEGRWGGPDLQSLKYQHSRRDRLTIDGIEYPFIPVDEIPLGFCEADVRLIVDNGEELNCVVVAGHVTTEVMETGGEGKEKVMGTVRPAAQWFMFEKEEVIMKRTRKVEERMNVKSQNVDHTSFQKRLRRSISRVVECLVNTKTGGK